MAITDIAPSVIMKSALANPDHAARIYDKGEIMKAQRAHAREIQTAGETMAKANARAWTTPEGLALRKAFDAAECPPGFFAAIAKVAPKPKGAAAEIESKAQAEMAARPTAFGSINAARAWVRRHVPDLAAKEREESLAARQAA